MPNKQKTSLQETIQKTENIMALKRAQNAHFARVSTWMFYLPGIYYREICLLGCVYAFQRQEGGGDCHMSLKSIADSLNLDRQNTRKLLDGLVKLGYMRKFSNGERRPATYAVDELVCIRAAEANGWHEGL